MIYWKIYKIEKLPDTQYLASGQLPQCVDVELEEFFTTNNLSQKANPQLYPYDDGRKLSGFLNINDDCYVTSGEWFDLVETPDDILNFVLQQVDVYDVCELCLIEGTYDDPCGGDSFESQFPMCLTDAPINPE